MKLALVYIVWDDWQMLSHSIRNMRPLADGVIIVGSTYSNHKEYSPIPDEFRNDELHVREPHFNIPMHSETDKRNFALDIARKQGYTHFLMMDSDEFYEPEPFLKAKRRFLNSNLAGLVCPCMVYFGSPELTLGMDVTLVPFIHQITPMLKFEFNRRYPHAWDGNKIRIDPTRSMNINSGVDYTGDVVMHHLSWVRDDYAKKIRNSTARVNLERSNILNQVVDAKEGDFIDFYGKRLTRCPNRFGIHVREGERIIHKDL